MKFEDLFSSRVTLNDLSAYAPGVWQEVVGDLKTRIKSGNAHSLAALRQDAKTSLQRLEASLGSTLSRPEGAEEKALRAKMTLMACDQFADVMTGKAGTKPSIKDRLVLSQGLLRRVRRGKAFSVKEFDGLWRWFENPAWASGELQRQGVWSIPTTEFCERVLRLAQGRPLLEVGAGRGFFSNSLSSVGAAVTAVDDFSWLDESKVRAPASFLASHAERLGVISMDAATALKTYKPSVVVCSWPPPGNEFEAEIFATPSVQLYIAVLSKLRLASGNWQTYQLQKEFHCTTSEPLNQLLRPREAEQQAFIFRRR